VAEYGKNGIMMKRLFRITLVMILLVIFGVIIAQRYPYLVTRILPDKPVQSVIQDLDFQTQLSANGFAMGQAVFIRIFKEEAELELWLKRAGGFALFKTYQICNYSGDLGPKLREGDRQSPEGFYHVGKTALNPNSSYHLSFNLGFPNAYDRGRNRTGSYLMVHGDCRSIGCYAMTDAGIEEIYGLGEAALNAGQPFFRVHAFPFRMTDARMGQAAEDRWFPFWQNLKQGYDAFEAEHMPPNVTVHEGDYIFG
jgi:murein L,D-transpeptidase YafK